MGYIATFCLLCYVPAVLLLEWLFEGTPLEGQSGPFAIGLLALGSILSLLIL